MPASDGLRAEGSMTPQGPQGRPTGSTRCLPLTAIARRMAPNVPVIF